ncbi:MAG: FGGY family carbohydrate kinase [Agriterribacter sp.]
MKTKIPVIAIFDIGKTNKKLLLFDEQYGLVKEVSNRFAEVTDDDGFPCDDIASLSEWILEQYRQLLHSEVHELKAVNFSTYGASLVHIDKEGKQIGYLYNYLKPYPPELMQQFLNARGGATVFSQQTSSPVMGHLNAGMQLYWLKENKPVFFNNIGTSLHFPQYLSFLLTGKRFAEMTNLGAHSAMWDFDKKQYHSWLQQENLRQRLCEVLPGDTAVSTPGTITIGIGLHDSSAATIPYLASFTEPFIILSTGTWTISLNPFNSSLPTAAELEKGCLSYLTYQGNPVKTAMLFAGNDHDQQVKRIADHFNVAPEFYQSLEYDASLIEKLQATQTAILPFIGSATTPGVFHSRVLSGFDDAIAAYYQLVVDIIAQQALSTRMILQNSSVKHMYVDGGFCRNKIYMQLLANTFTGIKVYATSMMQGTALGAAIAIHPHWNTQPLSKNLVTLRQWKPLGN